MLWGGRGGLGYGRAVLSLSEALGGKGLDRHLDADEAVSDCASVLNRHRTLEPASRLTNPPPAGGGERHTHAHTVTHTNKRANKQTHPHPHTHTHTHTTTTTATTADLPSMMRSPNLGSSAGFENFMKQFAAAHGGNSLGSMGIGGSLSTAGANNGLPSHVPATGPIAGAMGGSRQPAPR